MPFPYKHVLIVGATSGIGAAMANCLVQEGSKVIAVGRRQDRLDAFVREHGKGKASAVRFDISDRQNMDQFVSKSVLAACSPDFRNGELIVIQASLMNILTWTASS